MISPVHSKKHQGLGLAVAGLTLLSVITLGIASSQFGNQRESNILSSAALTGTASAYMPMINGKQPQTLSAMVLANHSAFTEHAPDGDHFRAVGEVVNTSSVAISVSLGMVISDAQGVAMDKGVTILPDIALLPGEKRCFAGDIPVAPPGWVGYRILTQTVSAYDAALVPANLTVFNVTHSTASDGAYNLVGQIRNDTAAYASRFVVDATLYNSQGIVIGCMRGVSNASTLAPGESTYFRAHFSGRDYADAFQYSVSPHFLPADQSPVAAPPVIVFFHAAADPADTGAGVTQIFVNGTYTGTTFYQAKYGSHIQFSWATSGAQTVVFDGLGTQPLSGSTASPSPVTITYTTTFHLQAVNPDGVKDAYIQIGLAPVPAPPAPYNVSYSDQTTSSVKINWNYDAAHVQDIIGFRIYKAPHGSSSFVKVIAETPMVPYGPVLNNAARIWTDTSGIVCAQQYYLVAVYRDTNYVPQQTAVGVPSILTSPCPQVLQ